MNNTLLILGAVAGFLYLKRKKKSIKKEEKLPIALPEPKKGTDVPGICKTSGSGGLLGSNTESTREGPSEQRYASNPSTNPGVSNPFPSSVSITRPINTSGTVMPQPIIYRPMSSGGII